MNAKRTPAAAKSTESKALTPYDSFKHEIAAREDELVSILPPHIKPEKFRNVALIAVKNDPSLLNADRRSLHKAITQAAEDGLHPDGREGTITVYSEKQKDGSYLKRAQWSPMLAGLRKRAMELSGLIVSAEVVYENDHFLWSQGDTPRIEHQPAPLGTDRGQPVGGYAIIKGRDGTILHREVMSKAQIEAVKSCSRAAATSLLWTKFWTEGWRKTVIRRAMKTVPCVPELERLIARDDETFDFSPQAQVHAPSPPPPPRRGNVVDLTPTAVEAPIAPPEADVVAEAAAPREVSTSALEEFTVAAKLCKSQSALSALWDRFEPRMEGDREAFAEAYEMRTVEIEDE